MKDKIHILVLPSWYPMHNNSISGSFFREQALLLKKHGNKVGVIAPCIKSLRNPSALFRTNYGLQYENDNGLHTYRWHSINITPKLNTLNRLRWIKAGNRAFEKYISIHGKPDIIHVHSLINSGFLALSIFKKYKIPYVVTEHSSVYGRGLLSKRNAGQLQQVVNSSSLNLAVSQSFKLLLNSTFKQSNWEYLPNIVNSEFLLAQMKTYNRVETFTFISVSSLDENKNITLLIKAFSKSFKGLENVRLQIAGDGPLKDSLIRLVKDEGIEHQVIFLGSLSRKNVIEHINNSDSLVLTSKYETFAIVLIEAMALGKPVIATQCGGPESIVTPETGFLVTNNSLEHLARVMKKMYLNYEDFDNYQIREICKKNFGEQRVITELEFKFKQIISI